MGQIILNVGQTVSSKSEWTIMGTYDNTDNKYYYSTPSPTTGQSVFKTIYTSRIPSNATVTSVSLTYKHRHYADGSSVTNHGYSHTTDWIYEGNNTKATNENIKNWLNSHKTEQGFQNFGLVFQYRGDGGRGVGDFIGSSYFWVTVLTYDVKLVINYEFSDGVEGENFSPLTGVTFGYHFSPMNLLAGEPTTGTYSIYGSGIYGFRVNYRPEGFSDHTTGDLISVVSENNTLIKTNSFGYSDYSTFPNRATQMEVSFDFYTDAEQTTFISTDWKNSGVYFLKERIAPSIAAAVSDSAGYLEKYGRPIQNLSELTYTLTFSPDPYSDATIIAKSAMLDGETINIVDDKIIRPINMPEGTRSQMIVETTDSYGLTTEEVYNLYSYTYTNPKLDVFKVSRYEIVDGVPVFAGAGEKGAISLKGATASLGEQNTYSIVFFDGVTETTIYEGVGALSINEVNNIEKLANYLFDLNQQYNCSLTLSDDLGSVTRFSTLRKSGAILLQVEQYGVGIGKAPTGTKENPTFDCGMPANITQPASFANVTGITTLNFEGTEYTIQFAPANSAAAGFITIVNEEEATTDA